MSVLDVDPITPATADGARPTVEIPAPQTLAETGLPADEILHLLVKSLHFAGELSGLQLAERLGLGFSVIEPGVDMMKAQRICEIVGGTTLGAPSYRYRITQLGREHAHTFLERNMYAGVAPVPIDQYRRYMTRFKESTDRPATRTEVRQAFSHLVLSDRVLDQLGPAINAGHSLFVYGPPGNGKTVIAQGIRNVLPGDLWIPHALEVDGSLIQVYDPVNHERLPEPPPGDGLESTSRHDARWVRCRRPAVMVGGELMLEHLELAHSPNAGFYRAPVQLLANGGVLIIDDFGRQQCSPQSILNRWITPLESRVDYLSLQSGQKVAIPFMVLPVFATNIKPVELVDEAFLRRIHYKVAAENPTEHDFHQIWANCCRERSLAFDGAIVSDLLHRIYPAHNARLRGCQPRDLIEQALALALYRGEPRRLTPELLESACATYFVDEQQGVTRLGQ
jgi:predicted ATPase with chaperone activity